MKLVFKMPEISSTLHCLGLLLSGERLKAVVVALGSTKVSHDPAVCKPHLNRSAGFTERDVFDR